MAVTAFNAKTLITNMNLAAQGKEYKNLDNAIMTVVGRVNTLRNNTNDLTTAMSKESLTIDDHIKKLRELAASYRDASAAKQGLAAAPDNVTGGGTTSPTTGNASTVPNSVIPDKGVIDETVQSTKGLNKNLTSGSSKIKTLGKNVMGLVGYVQMGIQAGLMIMSALE